MSQGRKNTARTNLICKEYGRNHKGEGMECSDGFFEYRNLVKKYTKYLVAS